MPDRVRLAVVMDPIGHIKPAKDSTLAMLLAAQARGWELLYLELGDIWLRDGEAWGRAAPLEVRNDLKNWYSRGQPQLERLGDLDVILMRKAGALVVNGPQGLRDMNEKVFTAWFPECCAPTLITRSMPDMAAFLAEHGKIVVKPLYGMGGRSIFVVERGDKNSNVVFETLTDYGERFAIAQRYLPEIATRGDARVLLIDGEPVPYALARIPSETDNRGNLAAGARGEGRPLSERDRWLASRIGPAMRERGMMFVGLDVIGDYVTEINVTSPTGIRELDKQFKLDIGALLMEAIARRLATRRSR